MDDYGARIQRYVTFEEHSLKEDGEQLLRAYVKHTPARAYRIALDARGKALTSVQFAQQLSAKMNASVPSIVFYIGAAYGYPQGFEKTVDERLCLSTMTLPHRLARLVLVEQIYRAFTIIHNQPYAHE